MNPLTVYFVTGLIMCVLAVVVTIMLFLRGHIDKRLTVSLLFYPALKLSFVAAFVIFFTS